MRIEFFKYEALGNDFILIDESQDRSAQPEPRTSLELRKLMCHRKKGIGADGVLTLLPSRSGTDLFMHITNADGTVPENCGNGLRCVAQYWRDAGRQNGNQDFVIGTLSGPKKASIDGSEISVELGVAKVRPLTGEPSIDGVCESFARRHGCSAPQALAAVDLGNPHLIVQSEDIEVARLELGPILEKISLFPNGANVSFVRIDSESEIAIRTWERGAGATDACGSGAGASIAALVAMQRLSAAKPLKAQFENGALSVLAHKNAALEYQVNLSGAAQRLFAGVWERTLLS